MSFLDTLGVDEELEPEPDALIDGEFEVLEEGDAEPPEDEDEQPSANAVAAAEEAKAYKRGWRPRDVWIADGKDPAKWVDAATFNARRDDNVGMLRNDLEAAQTVIRKLQQQETVWERERRELRESVDAALATAQKANSAGFQRALTDLKNRQRALAEAGEMDAFDAIGEQITAMEAERDAVPPAPARPAAPAAPAAEPALPAEYSAFLDANPWFHSDPVLRASMIAEHNIIMAAQPGVALAQQLQLAKGALQKRFPEKFGMTRTPRPADPARPRVASALAPRGNSPPPRRLTSPFDRIEDAGDKAQAKAAFEKLKRTNPTLSEADYVDILLEPHGDVLGAMAVNAAAIAKRRA